METLILRGSEIKRLVSMNDVIRVVEEAFREKSLGRVQMPVKTYLFFHKYGGDLRSMPSTLDNPETCAVKIVNFHPGNKRMNLPSVMATIVLIDPKTGAPLSIMDGTWLTAMRTGAATAVATKYLSRSNSTTVGFVGAGTQAFTQLRGIVSVRQIERVKAYDLSPQASQTFVDAMAAEQPKIRFQTVVSAEEAVRRSDVVVTVTPARGPVVYDHWISDGTHINAVGADAPGKQELDPAIFKRAKIFVDDRDQTFHAGEINVPLKQGLLRPEDIHGELGDVIAGKILGRQSDREITVFDSTGIAIEDAVTAKLVYDRALEKGLGVKIDLVS